jgi:hypothetical protein
MVLTADFNREMVLNEYRLKYVWPGLVLVQFGFSAVEPELS